MFAADSWSTYKRTPYSSQQQGDEFYSSHSHQKTPFQQLGSSSPFRRLSRNLYLRHFLSLVLGVFLGRTIFAPAHYQLPSIPYRHAENSVSPAGSKESINSTLGAAAIIALNSASRPDRRDYLALMGAMTDIKLTFINTWTTKPLPNALPSEHNPGLKDVEYACWRSHADAWRKVVEEGWATAMIMEDDVDWDGSIHESMALAWKALVEITHDPLAMTEAKSYQPLKLRGIWLMVDGIFSILGRVWNIQPRCFWLLTIPIYRKRQHGGLMIYSLNILRARRPFVA